MSSNSLTIEDRLAILEREIEILKSILIKREEIPRWQKISGMFENDPDFDEIVKEGQQIRESERGQEQ
ncbi:MAG: hypothetical protein ACUVXI_06785 [bacterium]